MLTDDFRTALKKDVEKKMAFIAGHQEELVAAWLANYGVPIEHATLVQEGDGLNVRVWVEPRSDFCVTHRSEVAALKAERRAWEEERALLVALAEAAGEYTGNLGQHHYWRCEHLKPGPDFCVCGGKKTWEALASWRAHTEARGI